jgi:hypothetical protein
MPMANAYRDPSRASLVDRSHAIDVITIARPTSHYRDHFRPYARVTALAENPSPAASGVH